MTISYQWLADYLPVPVPLNDLTNILTSIGLEVEGKETSGAVADSFDGLLVGEVLTCDKHPDADKLKVTTVNIGSGVPLNIVCGAPNVAKGQKVVVATIGTTLHPTTGEPFKIKKSKIRGALSEGMLCAEDEIGIGESHAGIMVLSGDAAVGTPLKDILKLPQPDTAIHIGLTPNRSDAMSHIGVARDVCAYLTHHNGSAHTVIMPRLSSAGATDITDISVRIEATEACPRYAGISLKDIRVAPSPDWLQDRLKTIGVRPINNVVDITNFVLHEYGQPLHAFDSDKIRGKEVIVRYEPEGTSFFALDGTERKLAVTDLMICDAEGGMCIAGVFGGKETGVNEQTTNIFLESAHFDRHFIRRTSLRHGLRTDAATRFEKGADINNVIPALQRAVSLMVELCGAKIASSLTDIYPAPISQSKIEVSLEYIRRLSGKAYSAEAVKSILLALGFGVSATDDAIFHLTVPSGKTDVLQPADIVEEILRIDGLDNIEIPDRLNITLIPQREDSRSEKLSELLFGLGFQEIVTNSITNSRYYADNPSLVRMLNSLTSELDVMRPQMLESGLEVVQYNANRKARDLQLFEWGKVYNTGNNRYQENWQLAIWLTGNVRSGDWQQPAKSADLYFVKGLIQNLLRRSGITKGISEGLNENGFTTWSCKGKVLAIAFEVPTSKLKEFDIRQPLFHGIIHWDAWQEAIKATTIKYAEVPKYPAVERDLSLVLPNGITYRRVQQETDALRLGSLQSYRLFDVFEAEKLGVGNKAYAMNYTFQLSGATLTDTEVEVAMQQLMRVYRDKLGATIRE